MVTLPNLRPRTSENVGHSIIERLPGRHRCRVAVDGKALRYAFHDRKRLAFVEIVLPVERVDDPHGIDERLVVVEHDLVLQPEELTRGVLARGVDLDRLEPVAEFETAVRNPALNVRGPSDQRLAVPEPDRVAEPLRDVGPEPRNGAAIVEFATDVDLRD